MVFDLSILKNIDFTKPDNLIFLCVIFVLAIFVLFLIFFVLAKIIRVIKIFLKRVFKKGNEKSKFIQEENVVRRDNNSQTEEKLVKEPVGAQAYKVANMDIERSLNFEGKNQNEVKKDAEEVDKEKEEKSISESLSRLSRGEKEEDETLASKMPSRNNVEENDERQKIKIPRVKRFVKDEGIKEVIESEKPLAEKNEEVEKMGVNDEPSEQIGLKIRKNLENNQNKIGSVPIPNKKIIQPNNQPVSKRVTPGAKDEVIVMAGKAENEKWKKESHPVEDLKYSLIKESLGEKNDAVKRFEGTKKFTDNTFISSVEKIIRRENQQKDKKAEEESVVMSSKLHNTDLFYDKGKMETARKTLEGQNSGIFGATNTRESKTGLLGSILGSKESQNKQAQQDSSIFGGKEEISRSELRQELKGDVKVFNAAKRVGLNMSPVQRAKLEKEVFSASLGRNISKTDFKVGIKKT